MSAPVTVIIPVRNGAAYLRAAITSVRTQSPPPAEIIVIDGGSSDDSPAIARRCGVERILHQSGVGLAQARNEALAHARSPLVGFCDADDRWTPGALAVRLAHLRKVPNAAAVIGHVQRCMLDGDMDAPVGPPRPGHTPGALIAHASLFADLGGFDESLSVGADTAWFVRLRDAAITLDTLDTITLLKGMRPDSLSREVETYRRELLTVARRHIAAHRQRS